jgi:hypothetical protein
MQILTWLPSNSKSRQIAFCKNFKVSEYHPTSPQPSSVLPVKVFRLLVYLNNGIYSGDCGSVRNHLCPVSLNSCSRNWLIEYQREKTISCVIVKSCRSLTCCVTHVHLLPKRKNKVLFKITGVHFPSCSERNSPI